MMGISQEQRDSHIPTNFCETLSVGLKTKTKDFQMGRWESGNPKAGFPLSHRPDSLRRMVKSSSTHRQRSATAQAINSASFLFRGRFAAHDGPFGRHTDCILDRSRALMEAPICQPD